MRRFSCFWLAVCRIWLTRRMAEGSCGPHGQAPRPLRLPALRSQARVHLFTDKELVHFGLKACVLRTTARERIFEEKQTSAGEQLSARLRHGQELIPANRKLGESPWEGGGEKPVASEAAAAAGGTQGPGSQGSPAPRESDSPALEAAWAWAGGPGWSSPRGSGQEPTFLVPCLGLRERPAQWVRCSPRVSRVDGSRKAAPRAAVKCRRVSAR